MTKYSAVKCVSICVAAMFMGANVGSAAALSGRAGSLQSQYKRTLESLKTELSKRIPTPAQAKGAALDRFLSSDALDAKLVKYVVLLEATPEGLARFAGQGAAQETLIKNLLADPGLMRQMLVADGARGGKYGRAMQIYTDIQKATPKAPCPVLRRLALALALEHAEPHKQRNATALADAPATVDPVKRFLSYQKAYLAGELDPAFDQLTVWDLRFVVDGEEPDAIAAWGRKMLRNFRPNHIYNPNYGWRYVAMVGSDIRYGSGDVKYDRPELQFFQNILMNGGVCGRRAFFGRFLLRAFGIPTTARPQRGHAALVHWTPKGWVPNLGGGWGAGWTKTVYDRDKDFLASTQARMDSDAYLKVKRAQWVGDVMGEKRTYGEHAKGTPAFWNSVSLKTQRKIIDESKVKTLAALGEELGESNETLAEKVMDAPVTAADKKIIYGKNGAIIIPAAAYSKPTRNTKEVNTMKSFEGGLQVFLPRFSRQGVTIMRGGAWRGSADSCRSGWRMPSSGYGRYNNWGFRVAVTPPQGRNTPREVKVDLGGGVSLELVYIGPGRFIMGGVNTKDSKWQGVEVPKHQVTITKGFYLGKYEVTQAQFQAIMGSNPSKAVKDPKCPADTISEGDALAFCGKVTAKTGLAARLPTEAEWEYACRAGSRTKYFFGDDPSTLSDYAWFDKNDGGKSHHVGQKKPNPWGLYDICGNVCERVSDTYAKDYYAKSPKEDPTGPKQSVHARMEYEVSVPHAGQYLMNAHVVTANYDQKLTVAVNDSPVKIDMVMPFTVGSWQDCAPIPLTLKQGRNVLRFSRVNPPQYGVAIKSFQLRPAR